ncbi:hypothetical protein BST81_09580 [Leptolyngbya sp. 'hensonii']|uniref:DUF3107 family protein n=1 Tax=Leptolyngbya sp. 'hensonii' TaxID=1922337 RepID=UPI00094FF950|nr:DUF3107 family protein [Leptolyngbya sp. 'hensonii']OLP18539.1 hypothetical protein BST81_09580 [Leptolyngbya sp. 'hensonii']
MFIIDIVIKNSPATLSVQRKSAQDAEAIYQQVLKALSAASPQILELTCEHQAGKKFGVLSSEITAVQLSEKATTATASGKPPGFFALAE